LSVTRARNAALTDPVFEKPLPPVDFQGLKRSALLRDFCCFAGEVLQKVSLRHLFESQREDRKFVSTVSRIMSSHCAVRSHLSRLRIIQEAICLCSKDYETVDHLIWHCRHLTDALTALDMHVETSRLDFLFQAR
jgi:hypothetical protein